MRAVFTLLRLFHWEFCTCSGDPYCRCTGYELPIVVPRRLRASRSPVPVATLRSGKR